MFVSGIIWRRRGASGAYPILVFLLGSICWSLFYALYWLVSAPVAKLFWLKMTYLGVVITPAAMLVFAIQFVQRSRRISAWKLGLLAIEPIITLILLWTDPLHGLFSGGKLTPVQTKIYEGGLWFWINVVYSYILIVACIVLLAYAVLRPNKLSRSQARLVLIGSLIPVAGNLVGFVGLNPFPTLDLTPVTFTLTGTFFAYSLLRFRLLDLIPIGRDLLLEIMDEGMLLLDPQRRILDVNPAAMKLLNLLGDVTGKSAEAVLGDHPNIVNLLAGSPRSIHELALRGEPLRYVRIQVMPVSDRAGFISGTVVIFHDITQQKIAEQNLRTQLRQIEALQVSLQEQAIRDPLTGLFNRRYLQETLPREVAKAEREKNSLGLVMIDIDNFKEINDTYGHLAGDEILQQLSIILMRHTREGDIAARFGGDEILVVLTGTPVHTACQRAAYWLNTFGEAGFEYEGQHIPVSFSAGVAVFPEHGLTADQLIRKVDAALYRAKSSGRNNIVLASDLGVERV
jgi:diguanylate cyclase (GGDEF)-like protein